ncbi:hypothetical protein CcrBL47_gp483 [Caulobacter phage BL47]|nr:hypothetical protein CcrBL47_gp483 [Caulobacter phage BL47]UTU10321.1 hypothetical protein CcrRB23_gp459 [Caulobacter phage RB23]
MKIGVNDQFWMEPVHGGWTVLFRAEAGNQSNSVEVARFLLVDYATAVACENSAAMLRNKLNIALDSEKAVFVATPKPWNPRGSYAAGDQVTFESEVYEYVSRTPRDFSQDDKVAMVPKYSGLWQDVKNERALEYARKMVADNAL